MIKNMDLGIPEFGGFYHLKLDKSGTMHCATDDCNVFDVNQIHPIDPRPRNDPISCKTCSFDSTDFTSDYNCVNNTAAVISETCQAEQVCQVSMTHVGDNYDGQNPHLIDCDNTVTRGCVDEIMASSSPETALRQRRYIGCYGNLCNMMGLDIDPEDMSPLPRPGRWDQPLNAVEASIFCGRMFENCIRCHICESWPADPYDQCVTNPENNPDGTHWFRKTYFDLRVDDWVENVCYLDVRQLSSNDVALSLSF